MADTAEAAGGIQALPTGTVTFLMTDIEGSTKLLQALGERYPALLEEHYRLLREACVAARGVEVSNEGDATFFVFRDAPSAVQAATDAQRLLASHAWPDGAVVEVRMGIHTGEGRLLGASYVGLDVHRTARIAGAAHGGQVVLSDASRALADGSLPDGAELHHLGEHRLKDLDRAEHLFQLVAPGLRTEFPPLHSLGTGLRNLPAQLTTFVGRTRERQELLALLGSSRLVTLTGPGGTGKTRLSLEVAAAAAIAFPDGVFYVPLAPIVDPELLVPTIAAALGLREGPGGRLHDRLISHLCERVLLLVLDNFEQLMAAAPEVRELLSGAPRLKVLVSSREPLRISGEQNFPVSPLPVPDRHSGASLEQLRSVDSVALFVQRARLLRPDFDLTPENAGAITEICARLDGLPLAIELAAARTRMFQPAEIASRLDHRLSFLAGGRALSERQRTLRGAIDWSHELLEPSEQVLFRRLAVFAGGGTLEAVEAVCRPDELGLDAVEGVSSLYEKSLLYRDDIAVAEFRFAMLETIREYGLERLNGFGEAADLHRRHAMHFLELAERTAERVDGLDQYPLLEMLDTEVDNLRGAIQWMIDEGDFEAALRLVSALNTFWIFRSHLSEGRRLLADLLALSETTLSADARAAGLGLASDLASWQADYETAIPLAEQSLALFREQDDLDGIAGQLTNLGWGTATSDPHRARAVFGEAIETYRRLGSPPKIGQALVGIAMPEMQFRNVGAAARYLEEASALFRGLGNESMAIIADGLRHVCLRLEGDLQGAREGYLDVLARAEAMNAHFPLTLPLTALADLALLDGDAERAAVLDAAQVKLAAELGGTPSFALMGIPSVADRARAQLGNERYEAAAAAGGVMPLEEVIRLARSSNPGAISRPSA